MHSYVNMSLIYTFKTLSTSKFIYIFKVSLIAVLNMGPIAIAWLLSAGGIISLLSYALKDLPSFLKWIVIGCSIAAGKT